MAKFQVRNDRAGLYITDYQELIREMKRIQPSLVTSLQNDFKRIAKPVQNNVENAIPLTPPTSGIHRKRPNSSVSGFYPRVVPGRLTWGANSQNKNIPVRSVKIEQPNAYKARRNMSRNKTNTSSIVRLRIDNPAVVMADMAGRSGAWINKRKITNEYKYSRSRSGVRRHKINNQGIGMIRGLHSRASRFVWPAADKSRSAVNAQTKLVLQRAYTSI